MAAQCAEPGRGTMNGLSMTMELGCCSVKRPELWFRKAMVTERNRVLKNKQDPSRGVQKDSEEETTHVGGRDSPWSSETVLSRRQGGIKGS